MNENYSSIEPVQLFAIIQDLQSDGSATPASTKITWWVDAAVNGMPFKRQNLFEFLGR